jgi:hypothetical protein
MGIHVLFIATVQVRGILDFRIFELIKRKHHQALARFLCKFYYRMTYFLFSGFMYSIEHILFKYYNTKFSLQNFASTGTKLWDP